MFLLKFWGGGNKEKQHVTNGSSSSDLGAETDEFKTKISPPKENREWQVIEERRVVDEEFDMVVVPSNGVHLSEYESDGPEWSIGWEEPHSAGFRADEDGSNDGGGGFVVLVPCYKLGCKELVYGLYNQFSSAIKNLSNGFSHGGSKSLQQQSSSSSSSKSH